MKDLQLAYDEGIILQTTEVERYGEVEDTIDEFILTNKNIFCIYSRKSKGPVKSVEMLDCISLDDFKIINGRVQIMKIVHPEYGDVVQFLYKNGHREFFTFGDEKEEIKWMNAINTAITGDETPIIEIVKSEKKSLFNRFQEKMTGIVLSSSDAETNKQFDNIVVKEAVNAEIEEDPCLYCGIKIQKDTKFCPNCGKPNRSSMKKSEQNIIKDDENGDQAEVSCNKDQPLESTFFERKQEFAGKIIKCPSCGAKLKSFTAICPDCGHEINMQNISSSLKEFINSISEYDKIIANEDEPTKSGWNTWSKAGRIWWIILNIFTSFIPLILYLTIPLVKPFFLPKSVPKLSVDEKRKASLIENYVFPNEREATIEAMMFTKSKMAFLASEKYNKKTLYWSNVWMTQAEQLNQRADVILNDDKIVKSTYTEIKASKDKIDRVVRMRAIIGVSVIAVSLVFVLINGSIFRGIKGILRSTNNTSKTSTNDDFSEEDTFDWLETGLSTKIPRVDAKKGEIHRNSDAELWISLEGISYSEFDKYITSCKEMGYTVEDAKDTYKYTAYNSEGYLLEISGGYSDSMRINLKAPQTGTLNYVWPESDLAQRIPYMEADSGETSADEEEKCEIFLYDILVEGFEAYVSLCENAGYSVDSEKSEKRYSGFNNEGYKISVSLDDMKKMTVTLEIPIKMTEIKWPTTDLAQMLPRPESEMGNIKTNTNTFFTVYIGNTTIDQYNDYVDNCIEKGFVKDFYRSDFRFSAKNGKKDTLSVNYEGFNTIYISVYNFDR